MTGAMRIAKTLRFPADVNEKMNEAATVRGLSSNDYVLLAVEQFLDTAAPEADERPRGEEKERIFFSLDQERGGVRGVIHTGHVDVRVEQRPDEFGHMRDIRLAIPRGRVASYPRSIAKSRLEEIGSGIWDQVGPGSALNGPAMSLSSLWDAYTSRKGDGCVFMLASPTDGPHNRRLRIGLSTKRPYAICKRLKTQTFTRPEESSLRRHEAELSWAWLKIVEPRLMSEIRARKKVSTSLSRFFSGVR